MGKLPSAPPRTIEEKRALVLLTWGRQRRKNLRGVARLTGVDRATVSRWVHALETLQLPTDAPRSGRPRKLDAAGVHLMKALVPSLGTAAKVAAAIRDYVPQSVTSRTVRRRLKEEGYKWKRCRYVRKLTAEHIAKRLTYARRHRDNGLAWRRIMFTDSAMFYCDRGESKWMHASEMNEQASDRFPIKVHVYGGISWEGRVGLWFVTGTTKHVAITPKVKGQRGATAAEYQALLKQHMLPAIRRAFPSGQADWWFMQDNAGIHTAKSEGNAKCARG